MRREREKRRRAREERRGESEVPGEGGVYIA